MTVVHENSHELKERLQSKDEEEHDEPITNRDIPQEVGPALDEQPLFILLVGNMLKMAQGESDFENVGHH